ncbi:hypothetical protein N5F08_03735 [Klebsiella pneumoniae]|nr:hypothetical protein [Klebsiella pneumoniae]
MLTKTDGAGVITAFDAGSDEEAMDMALLYINNTLGKKRSLAFLSSHNGNQPAVAIFIDLLRQSLYPTPK